MADLRVVDKNINAFLLIFYTYIQHFIYSFLRFLYSDLPFLASLILFKALIAIYTFLKHSYFIKYSEMHIFLIKTSLHKWIY